MIKPHPVFESLWYNILFSIIAIVMLGIQMFGIITKGFSDGPTVNLIIWIVISFHFIQKVYFCLNYFCLKAKKGS
jgi:hypothetical protein